MPISDAVGLHPQGTAVEMNPLRKVAIWLALLGLPSLASAHSFGVLYNLPMPFWLYAYGAAASLIVSFLIVGFFVSAPAPASVVTEPGAPAPRGQFVLHRWPVASALKGLSLGALLLCIATGFFGHRNPYTNFSMTYFWVIFLLGFTYLTAVFGNAFAALNPWRVWVGVISKLLPRFAAGRYAYPARLAHWPALALYIGFIWCELFLHVRPFPLAVLLTGYGALNMLALWLIGARAWLRHGEFFSVYFRLIALLSPLHYRAGTLRLRVPFSGLLRTQASDVSLLLFVLFMLSSTAYDGLRATVPWMKLFWHDQLGLIRPLIGGEMPIFRYGQLRVWYDRWEALCLLFSPLLYWLVYVLFLGAAKLITGCRWSVHALSLRFAFSLLPIALVYNVTHYYTLMLTQGVKIVSLISDPFGYGWNLFGTTGLLNAPILPDMKLVWHSQVALILLGHIASVWVAHHEALCTFETSRKAVLSQLPMLVLMVIFTTVGLWILSQPLTVGG